ncbi:unnamed protein product [Schistosoma guineensis]|nr:unnamed protein product [Schistosoma guineensis]
MTDKIHDCIMETITYGHDYTPTSIHHHGTNIKCNICPTTFPWHGDVTEHLRSVHGMQKSRENACNGKARSFCCSHFKYATKSRYDFGRHMRIHWGVKPFICIFCPYRSAWKCNLKSHTKSLHRKCFMCERELNKIMSQFENNTGTRTSAATAASSSSLTSGYEHTSTLPISQFEITTESSGDNTSDRYNCLHIDDEGKDNIITTTTTTTTTFPWHGDVTEHLRSVHGMQKSRENACNGKARSFCCSHCKYATKSRYHFSLHMRIHWGVKPFICIFCPYRSAWKSNLKSHIKSLHRKCFTCERELNEIMSQFENAAGTRTSAATAASSSSLTSGYEHTSTLPISQFEITTESSGDNTSDRYNCLHIDDEEKDNIITTTTTTTTTTFPWHGDDKMNSIVKSYSRKPSLKTNYSLLHNESNSMDTITQPLTVFSRPQITSITQSSLSSTASSHLSGLSGISPKSNEMISLDIECKNYSKFSDIQMTSNDPLNVIAYSCIKQLPSTTSSSSIAASLSKNSSLIQNNDDILSVNDSLPIDQSIGYPHKHDDIKNHILLTNTRPSSSELMSKISFGNSHHYAYPNFSTELNNSIYSGTKCFTTTTTTTIASPSIITSNSTITTDNTLSGTRFHYPILSNSQQNITHNITNTTTINTDNTSISPYIIGSLISDSLKNNASSNPTINSLFNIQQQVLMTALLQAFQRQQQHSQKYHELKQQQQSEQCKNLTTHYDTHGGVKTYYDNIISMTSPITSTIPRSLPPSYGRRYNWKSDVLRENKRKLRQQLEMNLREMQEAFLNNRDSVHFREQNAKMLLLAGHRLD